MKAFFKNGIMAYRGTCDGLTYYYNRRMRRMIVREGFFDTETQRDKRSTEKAEKTEGNLEDGKIGRRKSIDVEQGLLYKTKENKHRKLA